MTKTNIDDELAAPLKPPEATFAPGQYYSSKQVRKFSTSLRQTVGQSKAGFP
jgi:hypothetical protein